MIILVTGSSGLIGSEVVSFFASAGHSVHGIDNNMRASFFGPDGDTQWNRCRLEATYANYRHHNIDVRDRPRINELLDALRPAAIVHCAAQPSHDLAASRPLDDFDVNASGTINMLEATRRYAAEAVFVYLSTNKVYGDGPNGIPLVELEKRWDYADPAFRDGIAETFNIDQSMHSLFGASKLAADVIVQEYGLYHGMKTCCLRGGCLTGPAHAGVQLHGFLSFLIKTNLQRETYRIFGYKGKQVRDNIHAYDVATFVAAFIEDPRCGEVYNIGGGRGNSCSIIEAFELVEGITERPMLFEYREENRKGDHICYISNLAKIRTHYPEWNVTRTLVNIVEEIAAAWRSRSVA